MIPRDAPASVIAARYFPSATPDGTLVAEYDYDPYGRLICETGPKATSCPFRYSTKYRDPELDLYYYGHRWYDAASLKWLTPDPIGERGGVNLTAFCDGDPVNSVDPLGLWCLKGDFAIAEQGDTLSGLAIILGIDWRDLPFDGDPAKLQIGQAVNVVRWTAPLRLILKDYESRIEYLSKLRIDKLAFEDAIQEHADAHGRYNAYAVSRTARERRTLYEKTVAAAGLIETTVQVARLGESARRAYVVHILATATDRQRLAIEVLEATRSGSTIRITPAGSVLGFISAAFDAEAAGRAFGEGDYWEGSRRTSSAGVAVWGIWFPPAAIAGGIYALAIDPLLSYTIGGGALERRTAQNIVENDISYYQRLDRLIEAVSRHVGMMEQDMRRARGVFEQLAK